MEELTTPFEVLDALRGDITGEYQHDLKRLNAKGQTCTIEVYNEAYYMDQNP